MGNVVSVKVTKNAKKVHAIISCLQGTVEVYLLVIAVGQKSHYGPNIQKPILENQLLKFLRSGHFLCPDACLWLGPHEVHNLIFGAPLLAKGRVKRKGSECIIFLCVHFFAPLHILQVPKSGGRSVETKHHIERYERENERARAE